MCVCMVCFIGIWAAIMTYYQCTIKNACFMQQFLPQWKKCLTSAGPKSSQKTGIVIAFLSRDVKSVVFLTLEREKVQWWISGTGGGKKKVMSLDGLHLCLLLVCKGIAKWVDLHAQWQGMSAGWTCVGKPQWVGKQHRIALLCNTGARG